MRLCLSLLLIAAAALPLAAVAQRPAIDRQVAVTVDDLPSAALVSPEDPPNYCDAALHQDLTQRLLAQFEGIPVTGFVAEGAAICDDLRVTLLPDLLRAWLDAGHDLGNHTFSHRAFENVGRTAFEIDVVRGEATTAYVMAERGQQARYFRYPFLHAPADAADKIAFERFLDERGYRVAPVTFDGGEWIYASAYSKALRRGDTEAAERVAADYLRYMSDVFAFNEAFSRDLLGRELPQILLLHANPLNADHFDDLKALLEARGYRFVSLDTAMADEAYDRPDPYLGERGLSWLQRLAVGIEGKTRPEPSAPQWVRDAAGLAR
ncbi:MAG: polysaccharide deacetylase family protein [Bacteroidota bacterium]